MRTIISSYKMGDMRLIYQRGTDRKGNDCTGMLLVPESMKDKIIAEKEYDVEPLVQMKIVGDDYPFNYSHGRTMRGSQTGMKLHFAGQEEHEDEKEHTISTFLEDGRGLKCEHRVRLSKGDKACYVTCKVTNEMNREIKMEMISSFTLGGLTPFIDGTASEAMHLYQIRSTWANEGRLVSCPIEEEQLEPSWKPSGANGIRFGQVGSMPNREYFPFVGIEDKKSKVCWGVQLAIGSSWQLEAYRKDDALSLSGGIADREKGHWLKSLKEGQSFETPAAILSVAAGTMDELCQRITRTIQNHLTIHPEEQNLPIVFNEFCTTWGNPEAELMKQIVDTVAEKGIRYFVLDAGWYKTKTGRNDQWAIEHGDWNPSSELYPDGIGKLVEYIHEKGMKAGIWFEFENCGRESELFSNTELLYKRDGVPITVGNRRFLNMLNPKVWEYLDERVLGFLQKNQFDYIKIDYNANLGIGPEGGDSFGSQLYDSVQATQRYYQYLKKEIPGLLIENCAAGGHRLVEPFLNITDMSSYSDAHECMNIPLVAANMHRMIPVRQSQIWAVLHPEFSERMMYYKLTSTFLGRMCLSGDVQKLDKNQREIVTEAIDFYKKCAPIIEHGLSEIMTETGLSYKEPKGYQIVKRVWEDKMMIVVHTFEECPETIEVNLNGYCVTDVLKAHQIDVNEELNTIEIKGLKAFDGMVLLGQKECK